MTTITTTPQKAKVYAIFDNPPVVFACRVNQTFPTHDMVVEFIYDGVTTGAYTDVLPGMTILLGSAAGLSDKGITHVRKAITASIIYNGETSETEWANDLYVTVLQDWGIWVEYLRMASDQTVYMKYDVAYSNQHTNKLPVPIMGPDRVIRYEGAPVSLSFTGAASYAPGSTVASHLWTCAGATVTNGSTATPSISFATPGRYVVQYIVTSAQSVSNTTYRTVHVWSDQNYVVGGVTKTAFPVTEITIGSLSGDFDAGGWSFSLNTINDASTIRVRSKVILFSEEWYGDTKISYGQYAGAENIISIGWISDEQISINDIGGDFQVTVQGPQHWLNQVYNFIPMGIEYNASPTAWTQMASLTVDNVLWNLFIWRSTLVNCCDLFLTGDTRTATELVASPGSMWEQVKEIAFTSILAAPCCNRYGQVFIEIETVLLSNSGRSGVPNKGTITSADCESISVDRVLVTPTSQVVLSGVVVSGSAASTKFSMSRGHIPMRYGTPMKMERLLLSTQALSNELAGNLLEKANTQYRFAFNNLLYNNRLVDICPRQFITATIEAADNPRGIAYSGNAIVKHIDLKFEGDAWSITWDAVPETLSVLSMNGDIPADPGVAPWTPSEFPPVSYPSIKLPKLPPITLPLPPNPKVIAPLGIVTVLSNGKGLWTLNPAISTTTWINTTPLASGWLSGDLSTIHDFELSPLGIAYIVGTRNVWATSAISTPTKTVICSEAQFEVLYPPGFPYYSPGYWGTQSTGFDYTSPTGFALQMAGVWNTDGGFLMLNNAGTALVKTWSPGTVYYGGMRLTNYGGKWYYTGSDPSNRNNGVVARITSGLTAFDGTFTGWGTPNYWVGSIHAKAADILYTTSNPTAGGLTRYTNTANTYLLTTSAFGVLTGFQSYQQTMACDPTGQYVFAIQHGTLILNKSTNYGDAFTAIPYASFPSMSFDGRAPSSIAYPLIYNLGDSNKWLFTFNGTVYLEDGTHPTAGYLHIMYTSNCGVTWVDYTGNLHDPANGMSLLNILQIRDA